MFKKIGFWDLLRTLWITEKYAFHSKKESTHTMEKILQNMQAITHDEPREDFLLSIENIRSLCPVSNAIRTHVLDDGRETIEIDLSKCIECHICERFLDKTSARVGYDTDTLRLIVLQ